jgi:hypothetical protein
MIETISVRASMIRLTFSYDTAMKRGLMYGWTKIDISGLIFIRNNYPGLLRLMR